MGMIWKYLSPLLCHASLYINSGTDQKPLTWEDNRTFGGHCHSEATLRALHSVQWNP